MSAHEQPDLWDGQNPLPTAPNWTCADCGRENPGGSIFCRGCASTQEDDREPTLGEAKAPAPYDPSTAEIPY